MKAASPKPTSLFNRYWIGKRNILISFPANVRSQYYHTAEPRTLEVPRE